MRLDIIAYQDLLNGQNSSAQQTLASALFEKGIVGVSNVPTFLEKSQALIAAARQFSALDESIKQQYAPLRDTGDTEGYELGAEWFKDENGDWQIDDRKASYYAYVPNKPQNKWPQETDLKSSYLALGDLIFNTGKHVLSAIGLNTEAGIDHTQLAGYARMLHYQKVGNTDSSNPNWCGAHLDHDLLTGLTPAYYFCDGKEVDEPEEAGLFIKPHNGNQFEKIYVPDKSVMLFQIGEFAQLASNDKVQATKHLVKKAKGDIERFTYVLFYSPAESAKINSKSILISDERYANQKAQDGSLLYQQWRVASFERYRAAIASNQPDKS